MGPQELSAHIKTHLLPLSSLLVRIFPSGTLACLDGKKRNANVVKHSCLAGGSGRHIWQKLQMLMLKHSLVENVLSLYPFFGDLLGIQNQILSCFLI